MAPISNPYLSQRFRSLIWSCFDFDLLRTATFFAERYFYVDQENHEARHLFALALMRSGQKLSALHLVDLPNEARCGSCIEIYVQCCDALGRHRQGREALEAYLNNGGLTDNATSLFRESNTVPDEAVLQCRLGSLAIKTNLVDKAAAGFTRALSLNPLLWEAFEGLCAAGVFREIDELFPPRARLTKFQDDLPQVVQDRKAGPISTGTGFFTPEGPLVGGAPGGGRLWMPQPFRLDPHMRRDSIGSLDNSFFSVDNSMPFGPGNAKILCPPQSKQSASAAQSNTRFLSSADEKGPVTKKARGAPKIEATGGRREQDKSRSAVPTVNKTNLRRSTRLTSMVSNSIGKQHPSRDRRKSHYRARSNSAGSDMEDDLIAESPNSASVSSIAQSPRSDASPAPSNVTAGQEQTAQEVVEFEAADNYIYELMKIFAKATQKLACYECKTAIEELDKLPDDQQRSPSVMLMVGKAHYELNDYIKAERIFQDVRRLDPYRLWDMEIYSTLLWHLQRTVKLSFLAQELVSIDSRSPQAWIAIGNCFSLQKERAQALTCFRRATQLDSRCTYAYTLSGHESIDDDVVKAITFFQSALRADPRHYNAWYGLGTCYLRMSKIRLAEYHFRTAVDIHPHNAVLLGCLGMAVERRGAIDEAFQLFEKAVQIAPANVLVRYRRAKLLIGLKRYNAAIEDLKTLRDLAPEEANVVFQLARAYRLKGQSPEAEHALLIARDIAPKEIQKMKKLMEVMKDERQVEEEHEAKMEEG